MQSKSSSENALVWYDSFTGIKKAVFFCLYLISLILNLVDLLFLGLTFEDVVFKINLIYVVSITVIFLLQLIRVLSLRTAHGLIVYALFINIMVSLSISTSLPEFHSYVLRETMFIGILVPTGAMIIRNYHLLVMAAIYFVFFTVVLIVTKNPFLMDNSIVLLIAFAIFVAWVYYIFHVLKIGYGKQVDLISKLDQQNKQLDNQKRKLYELNETKDKFFSIVAHDLKNPFNTLLGFSNLLREQIKKKDYLRVEKYSDEIYETSKHGFNLLNNLLDWSRAQSGIMEFAPGEFDLEEMIDETVNLYSSSVSQKSLQIRIEIPQKLPVCADYNMLNTVIRNLVSNAIKYSYRNGEISIQAEKDDKETMFSITDQGIGIKQEAIDSLFRIDSKYTKEGTEGERGTGLGLILCHDFISQHKGRIWAVSEYGKGSTFKFVIPDKN